MQKDIKQEIEQILATLPLFSEFSENELNEVADSSTIKLYKKHDFIFAEGEAYHGFYIVLEGRIKVYKLSPDGKEAIVHLVKPFDPFAEVALFENLTTYPVNAQTIEDSLLIYISKDGFLKFLNTHPQINFKIISGFTKKMRELTNRLESLTLNEVSSRLAHYLLEEYKNAPLTEKNLPSVTITISKSDLAVYLGTALETLSRTLKKFQDDGLIVVKGKNVIIKDFKRLQKLSF